VKLEEETVWLNQNQLAELFQTTKQNVGQHIKNILAEGELESDPTVKDFFTVARGRPAEREKVGRTLQPRHDHLRPITTSSPHRCMSTTAWPTPPRRHLSCCILVHLGEPQLGLQRVSRSRKKKHEKRKGARIRSRIRSRDRKCSRCVDGQCGIVDRLGRCVWHWHIGIVIGRQRKKE
jgi:hypothetical protein